MVSGRLVVSGPVPSGVGLGALEVAGRRKQNLKNFVNQDFCPPSVGYGAPFSVLIKPARFRNNSAPLASAETPSWEKKLSKDEIEKLNFEQTGGVGLVLGGVLLQHAAAWCL